MQGLEVEGAELPEEVQARRAGRREGRRNIFRRIFFSRSYEGDPNLNKRKTLFVIVAVLVAALPFAFLVDQLAARRAAAREASLAALAVVDEPPIVSIAPPTPEEQPSQANAVVVEPADLPSPPSSPVVRDDLPPPPGLVDPSVVGAPPNTASSLSTFLSVVEHSPTASQPQGLRVFAEPLSPPTALTVATATTAPGQLNLLASTAQGAASLTPKTQATALNIAKAQPASTPASTLTVLKDVLPDDAALTTSSYSTSLELSSAEPNASRGSKSSFPQSSAQQDIHEGAEPPVLPEETSLTASSQEVGATQEQLANRENSSAPSNEPPITFQPGARIPAQLVTSVAVTEGVSSPVVAETPAGGTWCIEKECPAVIWLGTAKLSLPGRVELRLEQAVVDGEARAVTATALDKDNLPGLSASVSDSSPTVVQDLLRAAAGGVSDYVEALANRQSVTVKEGGVIIRDIEVPSLDQFLLGRAAKLFDLPNMQTAVVRLAQVEAGTELSVLYGVGE